MRLSVPSVTRCHGAQGAMYKISGRSVLCKLSAGTALFLALPTVAIVWASIRVVLGPGRWRVKLGALSVMLNLLFLFVVVLGYYVSEASPSTPEDEVALLGAEFAACRDAPLHFVIATPQTELAAAVEHSIYVAFDGIIRARFQFEGGSMDKLTEVHISDKHGRPWIRAPLEVGKLSYTRYRDEKSGIGSDVTLLDEDRDGIPDAMIDWQIPARFERNEIKWHRVKKGD